MLEVIIYGFNDGRCDISPFFYEIDDKNWAGMWELPVTNEVESELFSYLNDKSAQYYSSEEKFVESVNLKLKELFKRESASVNEIILRSIYLLKKSFNTCYAIGCLECANNNVEEERYNRSVQITNNVIKTIEKENLNNNVKIFVGEPHRLFMEHFLAKKFKSSIIASVSYSPFETTLKTPFVKEDIEKAEKLFI